MKRLPQLLVLLLGSALLSTCDVVNPEEDLPAFIQVDDPVLIQPNGDTTRSGVPDVWVIQGEELAGVFEPPLVFPTTNLDDSVFFFIPGVWENTNTNEHRRYNFLEVDSAVWQLTARDTFHISPVYRYRNIDTTILFPFREDYEDIGIQIEAIPNQRNQLNFQRSEFNPHSGNSSGVVNFTANDTLLRLRTDDPVDLPRQGEVWAEVAHRGDIKFSFGLMYEVAGVGGPQDRVAIFIPDNDIDGIIPEPPVEPDTWRTHYFFLTPIINTAPPNTPIWLFIRSDSDGKERQLFLDDIRVVNFK